MPKKKRCVKRSKQKGQVKPVSAYDRHHLCFIKRKWGGGSAYALRQFHYCIVPIPRVSLHRVIHENMALIPAPSELAAKEALRELRILEEHGAISDDDPIEKRLNLLAALFDCVAQPTADGFRTQLDIICKFYKEPS